jgi:hypothetical protein
LKEVEVTPVILPTTNETADIPPNTNETDRNGYPDPDDLILALLVYYHSITA